ncbi:unknown protein [Azorhizobium caulinodans ORS 571]|uniref:Uncharacterized protein n=1 Tax=Azorhizobium caulinodans (strain ATCC 43989 / DSM 5975 / JCM 20966 / LMG 6465 / NBRC 14845 / NCIMB 13405 / ORS 571) TaxID=438753 RepID=A8I4Y8_AZOC5|nr:hypothetical protein [Azorhizobium caulinodans]BAF87786.1 unknown protein [Azorhizobium caulinodans ORS 571]
MAWEQFEDRELHRVRSEISYAALQLKLLRFGLEQRYRVDQPRAPAGSPSGGQWIDSVSPDGNDLIPSSLHPAEDNPPSAIQNEDPWRSVGSGRDANGAFWEMAAGPNGSRVFAQTATEQSGLPWDSRYLVEGADGNVLFVENSGSTQTIYDGQGQPISRTTWSKTGIESEPVVQPAFLPLIVLAPEAAIATVELGLILYTYMATRRVEESRAPYISLNAAEFSGDQNESISLRRVGTASYQRVNQACKYFDEVNKITNTASVNAGDRANYVSAATYGTAVHVRVKESVEKLDIPNLVAERSYVKEKEEIKEAGYGRKGSIRVDVLENASNDTVCVYDIKTGKSSLSKARMLEIAQHAFLLNKNTKNIIIAEVRPKNETPD